MTLYNDTVTGNEALEGLPGPFSMGQTLVFGGPTAGGGIDIAAAATVSIDSSTLVNTADNYIGLANTLVFPPEISNINGTYILLFQAQG